MNKMSIKKDDLVVVLSGKDKGKQGKVLEVMPKSGKVVVEVSEAFYRPTDVVDLWGDPQKARTVLGWNPQKTSYEELCRLMAEHDLKLAKAEAIMLQETEK